LSKSLGPSAIMSEMLKAADDVGIQGMTNLCSAISSDRKIPKDWRKSWMLNVYKGKGNALECGLNQGITLLDKVMKVLYHVMERDKVQIESMQLGFRLGSGMSDAVFIVRLMQQQFLAKK
jgi:hypothetical protein